ncbi:MAG: hypothetical protein GY696_28855 [Gammaproteobacteria bacterium]|nr:hypothetical protein [Gammaproteobacteria bacterium]
MTEFLVAASFALVPLFIIVPIVGKYIDMRLMAPQIARYVSWEYTAHYVNLNDQPGGFSAIARAEMPLKLLATTQREAERRFLSRTSIPISTNTDRSGYNSSDRNALWTYHNGLPMYEQGSDSTASGSGSNSTPDKTGIFGDVVGLVGAGLNLIATAYNALGIDAGFDAMNPDGNLSIDGIYEVDVSIPIQSAPSYLTLNSGSRNPIFLDSPDLTMDAKSKLLTETWGAGGADHTLYQAKGLVPTVLIDTILNGFDTIINGWGIPIQDIASVGFAAPEFATDSLMFGYMTKDVVPVGALEDDDREVDCDGNYCVQE